MLVLLCLPALLDATPKLSNHLADATSPYLQQHKTNPVDWYPWGPEAFEKAKREHKPIFLSIGYSTCHWCHVMAHESFEDTQIAALLNRYFVNIKMDREEHPDVDKHFQRLFALANRRSGGWPLSVFLSETLKPFALFTYLPPQDAYGLEGMETLVPRLAAAYRSERDTLERQGGALESLAQRMQTLPETRLDEAARLAGLARKALAEDFDAHYKGFGDRPKFPEASRLRLLLDIGRLGGDATSMNMALQTLRAMAKSGLCDQVEGGFFRYATDRAWRMPHFEKMLYTNAELIPLYVRAYRISGDAAMRQVALKTAEAMIGRFKTKDDLFFGASDADSNGVEGGYFLYGYEETLGKLEQAGFSNKEARAVLRYLDVTFEGNADIGLSHVRLGAGAPPKDLPQVLGVMAGMRQNRSYPPIDTKIITAWNAMMVSALFEAGRLEARYRAQAEKSLVSLFALMRDGKGELYHQTLYGTQPEQPGMLEDYAYLIKALLDGYAATYNAAYLERAGQLAQRARKNFYVEGRWRLSKTFSTPADLQDDYYTSALSVMVQNLVTLAALQEKPEWFALAESGLAAFGALMNRMPEAYPEALRTYLRMRYGVVVLKGSADKIRRAEALSITHPYLLYKVTDEKGYQACGIGRCFAYGEDPGAIAGKIEALVQKEFMLR